MNRHLFFICILVVTIIKSQHIPKLLDAVQKCKETNLSDADIMRLVLRMETLPDEQNTKCAVACVFIKMKIMLQNNTVDAAAAGQLIKLFELPLDPNVLQNILTECADKLNDDSKYRKKYELEQPNECFEASKLLECLDDKRKG